MRVDHIVILVDQFVVGENDFNKVPGSYPTLYHRMTFSVHAFGPIHLWIDDICKLHDVAEGENVEQTLKGGNVWNVITMGP